MKYSFFFTLFFGLSFCNAQSNIVSSNLYPQAGVENKYYYTPPNKLVLPKNIEVIVAFINRGEEIKQIIPVKKIGTKYRFSFTAPDSTAVLIFSIVNQKRVVINNNSFVVEKEIIADNNNEEGYITYLYDKNNSLLPFANIDLASIRNSFAKYTLQLKTAPKVDIIQLYETAYNKHPWLKKEDTYTDYLIEKYRLEGKPVTQMLITYAKKCVAKKEDENKLLNAESIYRILKIDSAREETEHLILKIFPNGIMAKEIFWDSLDNSEVQSEESILAAKDHYINKFKDTTAFSINKFHDKIFLEIVFRKRKYEKINTYENLIQNKRRIYISFNAHAWGLANQNLDSMGTNLPFAKILSKKSIYLVDSLIKKGEKVNDFWQNLADIQDANFNTLALIFYKLGNFDSALYYQNLVYKKGKDYLDDGGYERLAAYMQKVKPLPETQSFIESALLNGINSHRMLLQLESIYNILKLPPDRFKQLRNQNEKAANKKYEQFVKYQMGSLNAPNFILKNIKGEVVALSSLKNKIVILDFWATWCAPCKAAFPNMKKLIQQFKADTNVVFLFIDVFEGKDTNKTREVVTKYMKESGYDFNVLFDENNKVTNAYKIQGIPQVFIINKKGNIIYIKSYLDSYDVITLKIDNEKMNQ